MVGAHRAPLFNRELGLNIRLALAVGASVVLMVLDARYDALTWLRGMAGVALHPLRVAVTEPVQVFGEALEFFSLHARLLDENRALRHQQERLAARQLEYEHLLVENTRLRAALDRPAPPGYTLLPVEVLHVPADTFTRSLTVDKGGQAGVPLGAPVVDAQGLVGQVTRVDPLSSEVTLLTSKRLSVPVQCKRTGLRLLASGSGSDRVLEMNQVDQHADLQVGDIMVTSGIDGLYPHGLPVARIVSVQPPRDSPFARARGVPVSGVGDTQFLMILIKGMP